MSIRNMYGVMHALSEVSAKEREDAARAELEAKDLAVAAGSSRPTRIRPEDSTSVYIRRAKLQGRVLEVQAKIRATLDDFENKEISILHLFEA